MLRHARAYLLAPLDIAPLATFRVLFGGIMLISVLRFMLRGWVHELYIAPDYFFPYYGFEWVQPLGATGMYAVFGVMAAAALGIALGAFYRIAAPVFFLTFTYVELLDKSNYLNHYYFVSIVAFLLLFVPAHRCFSVDVWRRPALRMETVPRWMVGMFRLQLGMVYFFAGLAKLNPDWLLRAMPLKIWLPAKAHLPIIGGLLKLPWVAFVFSWFGAVYDLTVPFLLMMRRTRWVAYAAVIAFHGMTWALFQIGMFPWIMMVGTLVFFPGKWHRGVIGWVQGRVFGRRGVAEGVGVRLRGQAPEAPGRSTRDRPFQGDRGGESADDRWGAKWGIIVLGVFFVVQVLMPFRYLLYPGKLFWTEEGFRFSWRVMLMEKAGHATFVVRDPRTGRESEVINSRYLTPNQEKMMATQPDMILQYAHFLEGEFQRQGIPDPEVRAQVYVTLNGSGSRPFIDPTRDLTEIREGFHHKDWVLPFDQGKFVSLR